MLTPDPEIIDIFISMTNYCRDDIRNISPGWGYVGPVLRGELSIKSIGMTTEEFNRGDRVNSGDLRARGNWIKMEAPEHCALFSLAFPDAGQDWEPTKKHRRTYFPAWIPSNFERLLNSCYELISSTGYEVTGVVMDKSVSDIGSVTIGFELDDELQCVGSGRTFVAGGLGFYKSAWEFNYEFHRPSISDIECDVSITHSFNNEPTIEFDDVWKFRDEFLHNTKFSRYSKFNDKHERRYEYSSDPYLGAIRMIEGPFHLLYSGNHHSRLVLP